jgi:hypothetical protein
MLRHDCVSLTASTIRTRARIHACRKWAPRTSFWRRLQLTPAILKSVKLEHHLC